MLFKKIAASWKAINICIDTLERFGLSADYIGNDTISLICKHTVESLEKSSNLNFDYQIRRSSAIAALCMLGSNEFYKFNIGNIKIPKDWIKNTAYEFKSGGNSASALDLKIVFTIAESGKISRQFTEEFLSVD